MKFNKNEIKNNNKINEIYLEKLSPSIIKYERNSWKIILDFNTTIYKKENLNFMLNSNLKNIFLSIYRGSLSGEYFRIYAKKVFIFHTLIFMIIYPFYI